MVGDSYLTSAEYLLLLITWNGDKAVVFNLADCTC